jgi:RNA polymerase sigma-54 factor
MKQVLQLKLGQHLTMTPQLQQAIRLLQLSALELNTEVQEALESNMMLEVDDGAEPEAEEYFAAPANGSSVSDVPESAAQEAAAEEATLEADEPEAGAASDIPEDLPVDSQWEDIYDGLTTHTSAAGRGDGESVEYEKFRTVEESLHEHLLWQVNLLNLSETDRAIAITIIDAINGDGYLESSIDEMREALAKNLEVAVENDEIEAVLKQIQALDPAGVGARDLCECLLLQLKQLPADTQWLKEAERVCREHLDALAGRDYAQLMRRLKLADEELLAVIHLIQSMNPRPGAVYSDVQLGYIVPDVYVKKFKGKWRVELNLDAIPQVRVNPRYASMIRRADNSPENSALKAHLQEARWFIKSLQSRSETLLRVATAIVERQQAFLEHGDEAMKPLVLHDIADSLSMHESTISRVTTRKYMHTPRGIYELKYFFSSHVSTSLGGEASSTAIRAVIKKLISAENARKPLSDSKIASLLSSQGINVARRTVAKYREAMAIPPSNERKRLA